MLKTGSNNLRSKYFLLAAFVTLAILIKAFFSVPSVSAGNDLPSQVQLNTLPAPQTNASTGTEFAEQTADLGGEEVQLAAIAERRQGSIVVEAGNGVPSQIRLNHLPARPSNALTGTEFANRTAHLGREEVQEAAIAELRRGNIPDFLRTMKPLAIQDGSGGNATIFVMPDYLAIGSDEDYLRIPLHYFNAKAICDELGCVLPSAKMVDDIYHQAEVKLTPQPLPVSRKMCSIGYFLRHNRMVQNQLRATGKDWNGALIAGHKKDVVQTMRLREKPNRVAIYGWHRFEGDPIQPLSTFHIAAYADYSHGVRPVWKTSWINGKPVPLTLAMDSPKFASLFSYESGQRVASRQSTQRIGPMSLR